MLSRIGAALRRASMARPTATGAATGFAVMSAGDAASQMLASDSSHVDVRRNLVSASYNGLASPFFYRWYLFMDWAIPGATAAQLVPKVLISQLVTTGANNPIYLAWCHHVEAWLDSRDANEPTDWGAVRERYMAHMARELPNLYGTSMLFWLPVNYVNFAWVPYHLKILWISCCSVAWGGFVSHVAHRDAKSTDS